MELSRKALLELPLKSLQVLALKMCGFAFVEYGDYYVKINREERIHVIDKKLIAVASALSDAIDVDLVIDQTLVEFITLSAKKTLSLSNDYATDAEEFDTSGMGYFFSFIRDRDEKISVIHGLSHSLWSLLKSVAVGDKEDIASRMSQDNSEEDYHELVLKKEIPDTVPLSMKKRALIFAYHLNEHNNPEYFPLRSFNIVSQWTVSQAKISDMGDDWV